MNKFTILLTCYIIEITDFLDRCNGTWRDQTFFAGHSRYLEVPPPPPNSRLDRLIETKKFKYFVRRLNLIIKVFGHKY